MRKSTRQTKNVIANGQTQNPLRGMLEITDIVEPFLKKYQTGNPMNPLLYFDLRSPAMNLLELVVKPTVIDACKTGKQLTEIDLSKKR